MWEHVGLHFSVNVILAAPGPKPSTLPANTGASGDTLERSNGSRSPRRTLVPTTMLAILVSASDLVATSSSSFAGRKRAKATIPPMSGASVATRTMTFAT